MVTFSTQFSTIFDFRTILALWESAGVFDILLPFLLIFSMVFAILEKSKVLGQNRAIYAIISLTLAFFAISNPFITGFFAILFANAALGFSIILVVILFLGFFITKDDETWWKGIGAVFAVVIFIWVLGRAFRQAGFNPILFDIFQNNPALYSSIFWIGGILLMVVIVVALTPKGAHGDTILDQLTKRRR